MKWGGYGPGKANAVYVDAATQRDLLYAAHERCGPDDHIEAVMAGIVGEAVRLWREEEERKRAPGCALAMDGLGDLADPDKLREFLHADSPTYKAARSWPAESRLADGTAPGTAKVADIVEAAQRRYITPSEAMRALSCVGDPDACTCCDCEAARRGA